MALTKITLNLFSGELPIAVGRLLLLVVRYAGIAQVHTGLLGVLQVVSAFAAQVALLSILVAAPTLPPAVTPTASTPAAIVAVVVSVVEVAVVVAVVVVVVVVGHVPGHVEPKAINLLLMVVGPPWVWVPGTLRRTPENGTSHPLRRRPSPLQRLVLKVVAHGVRVRSARPVGARGWGRHAAIVEKWSALGPVGPAVIVEEELAWALVRHAHAALEQPWGGNQHHPSNHSSRPGTVQPT